MAALCNRERQEDELQVLQAIFMDDFQDLRNRDAWKVDRAPEVSLTLRPQQSIGNFGEHYVQVDLIISCPANYPDVIPKLKLENSKGLSNSQIEELTTDLETVAKKNVGQEMLLELSQHVQQFLYANNKPPAKSFYEQMMTNKKRQEEKYAQEEEKKLELKRKKKEKERQIIEDHLLKIKEAQREETRKRKEEKRQDSQDRELESANHNESPSHSPIKSGSPSDTQLRSVHLTASMSPSPVVVRRQNSENDTRSTRQRSTSRNYDDSPPVQCKHHFGGVMDITFTTNKQDHSAHKGTCLGHGLHGSTVYVGIDKKTGEPVAISEWVLQWRQVVKKKQSSCSGIERDTEAENYVKQIVSIEQEMSSLLKLHHRNLLHYLAFKYIEEQGRITVYVLIEFSGGQNLDIYLTRKVLPIDLLHAYTLELLEALEFLHNKAVVHKNLRASSVFVDMHGRIRLADYSVNKRLCDLYTVVENSKPGVKFTDKQSPIIGRGGKKGDVYQLGLLLLSLSLGSQVEDLLPVVPPHLPPVLQDFLTKCLLKDDKLRWSTSQLMEHQFVKEPIPKMITQPAGGEEKQKKQQGEEEESDDSDTDLSPVITAWEASGHSRLTNEFEVLKSLGKGGFGDVIKVKNKLDGRNYAIKRIPLNPRSQQFNKKITREVKLLSRLNHENVVRYYNSWIETSDETASSESGSSSLLSGTPKNSESQKKVGLPLNYLKNSLDLTDDIEKFAPMANSSDDFSSLLDISRSRSQGFRSNQTDSSSESESEDDDEDFLGLSFMHADVEESIEGVVFEENLEDTDIGIEQTGDNKENKEGNIEQSSAIVCKQYLYIQMEYCEKSTLRNCIDAGLYQEGDRVWRLFREIVEGLMHIHEQGIIHRDLKPVNIFLDSNDHVKIGDLGLATSDILSKSTLKDCAMLATSAGDIHDNMSRSGSLGDGSLTGRVGTALYVSPEMMIVRQNRVTYSQKVDIYSLGIMFFEMCYKPLDTNMERVKILGQLRMKDVNFPEEFDITEMENQYHIIKWLLNHDPNERPTAKEILKSGWLPPAQMEEAELNEVLSTAISDPQSKPYHRMMHALFSQKPSVVDDHIFDSDIPGHKGITAVQTALMQRQVHESLLRVFHLHGAVKLTTPLLMPRPQMYETFDQYPCLMDQSGRLVGLPYDLRVPFARYITRANIVNVKRYSIERVYRKKRGFHPRELIECAFDIVTNYVSLVPDAEVLVVVQEIIQEFPPLQQRNYYIRMNHTLLLKAALLHVDIKEQDHLTVLTALAESKRDMKSWLKVLSQFALSETAATMLLNTLEIEGPLKKVESILQIITKTHGKAGSLAKKALHELEAVNTYAKHLGQKLPVIVSVGMINFNYQVYNGVVFQVTLDVVKKKKQMTEVLAAGGRYDDLIFAVRTLEYCVKSPYPTRPMVSFDMSFHTILKFSELPYQHNMIHHFESGVLMAAQTPVSRYGVGFSINFEKIVSAMQDQKDSPPSYAFDVLVCSIGRKPMFKEQLLLVKELWAAGLSADVLNETLESPEEIQDFCRDHGISQLVILKDSEGNNVKVKSIEKEKITEKVMFSSQVVEFLTSKLQNCTSDQRSGMQMPNSKPGEKTQTQSENTSNSSTTSTSTASFNFVMPDNNKLPSNVRKKHEAMIISKVKTSFPWLSVKCMDVIAADLTVSAIRIIAALIDVDSNEKAFESSIGPIAEKLPRHRKYLSKITDCIHQLVFKDKCSCVILYGLKDDSAKLLTSSIS